MAQRQAAAAGRRETGPVVRPTEHVAAVRRLRPGILDALTRLRAAKVDWPAWCWVPVSVVEGVLALGVAGGTRAVSDLEAAAHTAVAAWRQTQGIYRFDPDVLDALWRTPVAGNLPTELLERLPEWCVYVETPGRSAFGTRIEGFYASLDFDTIRNSQLLRVALDSPDGLLPVPLELGGSLGGAIDRLNADAARALGEGRIDAETAAVGASVRAAVEPLVSLVLYLCSEAAEISDRRDSSRHPEGFRDPVRVPNSPTVWETSSRLGARLRAARTAAEVSGGGAHAAPRPHVRRAHWHHYWTGSKSGHDRRLVLRWVHPTLVGGDESGLVATIRDVD